MPTGVYSHKSNQGFQKGHGRFPGRTTKGQFFKGQVAWNKGMKMPPMSEDTRRKMSISRTGISKNAGKLSHFWKGGISREKGYTAVASRRYRSRKQKNGGNHTLEQWEKLKRIFDFMCLCCKRQEPEILLTADHIIPISKGGNNDISNIQPLCLQCNSIKNIKIIDYRQNLYEQSRAN